MFILFNEVAFLFLMRDRLQMADDIEIIDIRIND